MNILIIHTAFIGDIVLSTALISKIADKYENANIYFLTTPLGKEVLKNNPKLKEIIVYDKKNKDKGFKVFFKLIGKIRRKNIDICFCPHRYMRSSLISFFSGAKIKVGYDIASFSFIYNKKIKYDKTKHEVEKLLSFVDENRDRYDLELYPSKEDKRKIDAILKNKNKKVIVIAPGSKWFTKKWPEKYFCELIERLKKNSSYEIIIIGAEEEKNINLNLDENLLNKTILDLRGKTSLLELAEIISRGDVLISNDSSPIHIASAFPTTRIFGIFGPTVKEFGFFPWSKNSKVFEVPKLDCRPCGIHGGNKCPQKHFRCMLEIKPEIIEKEINFYLMERN